MIANYVIGLGPGQPPRLSSVSEECWVKFNSAARCINGRAHSSPAGCTFQHPAGLVIILPHSLFFWTYPPNRPEKKPTLWSQSWPSCRCRWGGGRGRGAGDRVTRGLLLVDSFITWVWHGQVFCFSQNVSIVLWSSFTGRVRWPPFHQKAWIEPFQILNQIHVHFGIRSSLRI
jgi:hypothetical protein